MLSSQWSKLTDSYQVPNFIDIRVTDESSMENQHRIFLTYRTVTNRNEKAVELLSEAFKIQRICLKRCSQGVLGEFSMFRERMHDMIEQDCCT